MIKNYVKFYREEKGFSQAELAEKICISRNSISSIERGEYNPSLETAFELCEALQVPIYELFEYYKNADDVLDEKSIEIEEKEDMIATLNSTIDAWINHEMRAMAKVYKKGKLSEADSYLIRLYRFMINFYSFMQCHGIAAFMEYLEKKNIFKE